MTPIPGFTASPTDMIETTVRASAKPAVLSTATPSPTLPKKTLVNEPSRTPTPTAMPQSAVEYRKDCIEIEEKLPSDLRLSGAMLLSGGRWESSRYYSLYHLDLMSQREAPLPSSVGPFKLSPDGKWLAYLNLADDEKGQPKGRILQVTNTEGRHLDMSSWGLNWQKLVGWQDEKHLILEAPGYPTGNFLILNPFTMQKEVIKIDVPLRLTGVEQVYPDLSLSYWVIQPDDSSSGYHWRLLRRDGWQPLWEDHGSSFNYPDWSPDGRSFAVIGSLFHSSYWVLLNVGLDGKAAPLTNQIGEGKELSWSPDSRFLAGWLQMDPASDGFPNHLVLIDVNKSQLSDLCLENQRVNNYDRNTPPVWSPDGRFLAIGLSHIESKKADVEYYIRETVSDTALIDLQEHRAYLLVKDAIPRAWMRKPN